MRIALPKLFGKKTRYDFQKANLEESTSELRNPARGWYRIFPFYAEEEPDFQKISWCIGENDTLALVIINIGAFREEKLSDAALNNIREILCFFRENLYDVILRITYDHEGKALEREPFFFTQVQEHITQLCPIINEFSDTIFVFQGMLIGNWGEMHTSKFVMPQKLRDIWAILRKNTVASVFFAVRKPSFWRILHPECCNKEQLTFDNMGLFDDAMFGSVTHLGTFGSADKETVGWESVWSRESELRFEDMLCKHVPNGGEALCGEQYSQEGNVQNTLEVFKKMHITYLNKTYDKLILNLWKEWKYEFPGVWSNFSAYDYIGRHLGYRFWIKNVTMMPVENNPTKFNLNIEVENVGFANLYQEAVLLLEVISESGKDSIVVDCDMRKWNCGETQVIETGIEPKNGRLYLSAERKSDGRIIYFANQSERNGRVLLGKTLDTQAR